MDDEEHQYRLHVSGFSGTVQDSFSWYHDKQSFSTPDSGNICAEISHGGWWYNQCFYANLNGVYYRVSARTDKPLLPAVRGTNVYYSLILQGGHYTPKGRGPLGPDGIVWYSWRDSDYYSLRKVSMMIRPRNFRTRLSPWTHQHQALFSRTWDFVYCLKLIRKDASARYCAINVPKETETHFPPTLFLETQTLYCRVYVLFSCHLDIFHSVRGSQLFLIFYICFVRCSLILWHTVSNATNKKKVNILHVFDRGWRSSVWDYWANYWMVSAPMLAWSTIRNHCINFSWNKNLNIIAQASKKINCKIDKIISPLKSSGLTV